MNINVLLVLIYALDVDDFVLLVLLLWLICVSFLD